LFCTGTLRHRELSICYFSSTIMFLPKARKGYSKVAADVLDYQPSSLDNGSRPFRDPPAASSTAAVLLWAALMLSLVLSSRLGYRLLQTESSSTAAHPIRGHSLPFSSPVAQPGLLSNLSLEPFASDGAFLHEYDQQTIQFDVIRPAAVARVKRSMPFQSFDQESDPEWEPRILSEPRPRAI